MDKIRISIRLPQNTLEAVDELRGQDFTRTETIENALRKLLRAYQNDQLPGIAETLLKRDPCRNGRVLVYIRLDHQLYEYIRLNQLNLTTCVITALKLYVLP